MAKLGIFELSLRLRVKDFRLKTCRGHLAVKKTGKYR